MKFDKNTLIKMAIVVVVATPLFGICILFYSYAALGSDSLTVLEEGMSKFFHISLGNAAIIYNVASVVIGFLFARKYIGLTTVINALLIGFCVNLLEPVLKPFLTLSTTIPFRVLVFAIGWFTCCLGCAVLIWGKSGMSAMDAFATKIADLLHKEYRFVRIGCDAVAMLAGWLMGGVVGVGSIVAMFGTGPFISWMVGILNKVFKY